MSGSADTCAKAVLLKFLTRPRVPGRSLCHPSPSGSPAWDRFGEEGLWWGGSPVRERKAEPLVHSFKHLGVVGRNVLL